MPSFQENQKRVSEAFKLAVQRAYLIRRTPAGQRSIDHAERLNNAVADAQALAIEMVAHRYNTFDKGLESPGTDLHNKLYDLATLLDENVYESSWFTENRLSVLASVRDINEDAPRRVTDEAKNANRERINSLLIPHGAPSQLLNMFRPRNFTDEQLVTLGTRIGQVNEAVRDLIERPTANERRFFADITTENVDAALRSEQYQDIMGRVARQNDQTDWRGEPTLRGNAARTGREFLERVNAPDPSSDTTAQEQVATTPPAPPSNQSTYQQRQHAAEANLLDIIESGEDRAALRWANQAYGNDPDAGPSTAPPAQAIIEYLAHEGHAANNRTPLPEPLENQIQNVGRQLDHLPIVGENGVEQRRNLLQTLNETAARDLRDGKVTAGLLASLQDDDTHSNNKTSGAAGADLKKAARALKKIGITIEKDVNNELKKLKKEADEKARKERKEAAKRKAEEKRLEKLEEDVLKEMWEEDEKKRGVGQEKANGRSKRKKGPIKITDKEKKHAVANIEVLEGDSRYQTVLEQIRRERGGGLGGRNLDEETLREIAAEARKVIAQFQANEPGVDHLGQQARDREIQERAQVLQLERERAAQVELENANRNRQRQASKMGISANNQPQLSGTARRLAQLAQQPTGNSTSNMGASNSNQRQLSGTARRLAQLAQQHASNATAPNHQQAGRGTVDLTGAGDNDVQTQNNQNRDNLIMVDSTTNGADTAHSAGDNQQTQNLAEGESQPRNRGLDWHTVTGEQYHVEGDSDEIETITAALYRLSRDEIHIITNGGENSITGNLLYNRLTAEQIDRINNIDDDAAADNVVYCDVPDEMANREEIDRYLNALTGNEINALTRRGEDTITLELLHERLTEEQLNRATHYNWEFYPDAQPDPPLNPALEEIRQNLIDEAYERRAGFIEDGINADEAYEEFRADIELIANYNAEQLEQFRQTKETANTGSPSDIEQSSTGSNQRMGSETTSQTDSIVSSGHTLIAEGDEYGNLVYTRHDLEQIDAAAAEALAAQGSSSATQENGSDKVSKSSERQYDEISLTSADLKQIDSTIAAALADKHQRHAADGNVAASPTHPHELSNDPIESFNSNEDASSSSKPSNTTSNPRLTKEVLSRHNQQDHRTADEQRGENLQRAGINSLSSSERSSPNSRQQDGGSGNHPSTGSRQNQQDDANQIGSHSPVHDFGGGASPLRADSDESTRTPSNVPSVQGKKRQAGGEARTSKGAKKSKSGQQEAAYENDSNDSLMKDDVWMPPNSKENLPAKNPGKQKAGSEHSSNDSLWKDPISDPAPEKPKRQRRRKPTGVLAKPDASGWIKRSGPKGSQVRNSGSSPHSRTNNANRNRSAPTTTDEPQNTSSNVMHRTGLQRQNNADPNQATPQSAAAGHQRGGAVVRLGEGNNEDARSSDTASTSSVQLDNRKREGRSR